MIRILLLSIVFITLNVFAQVDSLPLNQLRVLASHNSYKKKPDPKVGHFLSKFKKRLGEENDPIRIEYGHEPLMVQLDSFNVRGFELDVYADPDGKKYYKRRVNGLIRGIHKRSEIDDLKEPGFKLLHIADIDYETHYYTFRQALDELVQWSNEHPGHLPLYINVEAKGRAMGDESSALRFIGFQKAIKFDSCIYSMLNDEIIGAIPSDKLLTPYDFMEGNRTVRERISQIGWPSVDAMRGKMFFILEGSQSDWYADQLEEGADYPMFVYGDPGDSMTLFVKRNEPRGNEDEIRELAENYIVRTRSDAETIEARNNDDSRKKAAIKSGAQIISTDYYKPDLELSEFMISLSEINGAQ